MKFVRLIVLLICSLSIGTGWSQFSYSFKNYTIFDFKAANQNWDISGENGEKLYVANNEGLLEYNGLTWKLWRLPEKTIVRSVLVDNGQIYTGTYRDFGFWQRDEFGDLRYQSLSNKLLQDSIGVDEEIWQIVKFQNKIIFRSFQKLYVLQDEKIIAFPAPSTIMSCSVVGKEVFVATLRDGILKYTSDSLQSFCTHPTLDGKRIVSIQAQQSNYFIVTRDNGCYMLHPSGDITPWNGLVNEALKKDQVNKFNILDNGNHVFGTIKNGIYITDAQGHVIYNVNKEIGIVNNTVLGQYLADNNALWLGFDNGIALVDLNTSNYFYKDITGKLGGVYDVIYHEGVIYVGSNTGLYYIDPQTNVLKFIEGSQGQVWELKSIKGDLFCGHNNGTYLIENFKLHNISSRTGGWTLKQVPDSDKFYVQGTYTGLVRYNWVHGKWSSLPIFGPFIPIRFLEFEDDQTLWIAHYNKGVFRVKLSADYTRVEESIDYSHKGLLSDHAVRIEKIKNTIVFHTNEGWQKYDAIRDTILTDDYLNTHLGRSAYLISEEDKPIWFKKGSSIVMNSELDPTNNLFIPNYYYKNKLLTDYEKISAFTDSSYFLNLYDGFMIIQPGEFRKTERMPLPKIESIRVKGEKVKIDQREIRIPFQNNQLEFEVSSFFTNDHFYEYQLISERKDSNWYVLEGNTMLFANLADGRYQINFKAKAHGLEDSPINTVRFEILPPFYKSIGAILFYVAILFGSIYWIYYSNQQKIKKQKLSLQVAFEAEQKKLLKEKEIESTQKIMALKNESLQREVTLKTKELANSAMALVKKNEVLLAIKETLNDRKSQIADKELVRKLFKIIDFNLEHESDWELFENNFNQVHEEFMDKLKHNHPALSSKDLKLCAYIKMNLTSKEIAPLMNISIRGVETHRYRLKKKLDLEKDDALTQYLESV